MRIAEIDFVEVVGKARGNAYDVFGCQKFVVAFPIHRLAERSGKAGKFVFGKVIHGLLSKSCARQRNILESLGHLEILRHYDRICME